MEFTSLKLNDLQTNFKTYGKKYFGGQTRNFVGKIMDEDIKNTTENIIIKVENIGIYHKYPFPYEEDLKDFTRYAKYGNECEIYFHKIQDIMENDDINSFFHPEDIIMNKPIQGGKDKFENSFQCLCGCNEYFNREEFIIDSINGIWKPLLSDKTKKNLKLFQNHLVMNKLIITKSQYACGYNGNCDFLINENILCEFKCSNKEPLYEHFIQLLVYALLNNKLNIEYLYQYNPLNGKLYIIDMKSFDKERLFQHFTKYIN